MRHPNLLSRASALLVVVDMQEPFLKPIFERDRVVERVKLLVRAATTLEVPILTTTQYADRMGPCTNEIAEFLPADCASVDKTAFSSCSVEPFSLALQSARRQQIVVCGIEAHICVNQTTHDLIHAGYQVHVAADAVSSRSAFNAEQALARMAASGAVLTNAESAIYEMLGRSGTPEFKAILPLVR